MIIDVNTRLKAISMQKNIRSGQTAMGVGGGAAGADTAAAADTLPPTVSLPAPPAPLLLPWLPAPALELVIDALPVPTRQIIRAANRAARDAVDARCTHLGRRVRGGDGPDGGSSGGGGGGGGGSGGGGATVDGHAADAADAEADGESGGEAADGDAADGDTDNSDADNSNTALAALLRMAPRLHSIERIDLGGAPLSLADCAALAGALERLPANGAAALRELRAGPFDLTTAQPPASSSQVAPRFLMRLVTTINGLLLVLTGAKLRARGRRDDAAAALAHALGSACPALARLSVGVAGAFPHELSADSAAPPLRLPLPPCPPLSRLEALALGGDAALMLLPKLCLEQPLCGGLTRLCDLQLDLDGLKARDIKRRMPARNSQPWRTPWMVQLTRLSLLGGRRAVLQFWAKALAPGSLRALRAFEVGACASGRHLTAATLRALLDTCDAAALESLTLRRAAGAAVRDVAASLPALSSFELGDPDFAPHGYDFDSNAFWNASERWQDFVAAPLAPGLTRLDVFVGGAVLGWPGVDRLLGTTPLDGDPPDWADSLRELALRGMDEAQSRPGEPRPCSNPPGFRTLRDLRGLKAFTALRKLSLELPGLHVAALEHLMRYRFLTDEWVPRLVELEFKVGGGGVDADTLRALLRLPFSERLERLVVDRPSDPEADAALQRFLQGDAKALLPPRCVVEFSPAGRPT